MSILILILKIIGILLLILLILAALIFFHPIYYQIEGKKEEELSAHGYFWWMFQILRLEFELKSDDIKVRFRIFGVTKKTDTKEEVKESPKEAETDFQLPAKEELYQENVQQAQEDEPVIVKKESENPVKHSKPQKKSKSDKKPKQPKQKKKESNKMDTLKRVQKEVTDEGNRQAVSHLWQEFWYLVSHLKPNYIESDISFSTGDPAATGKLTGALSLLPLLYRYDAKIYPDFLSDEAYVKGRLNLKGHIALFHFVRSLIRLIRDENTKQLYDKIRK